jgi:hypothetical protein
MRLTWHKRFLQAAIAVAALVLLLIPTAASARIYKWIDETGTTVFSDAPPRNAAKAKSLEIVMEDDKALSPTSEQIARAEALRREEQLRERVYSLQRQLQAQQQYQMPLPPPQPVNYEYAGPYYPGYYAYSYPYVVAPARVGRTTRAFAPHRLASRSFARARHRDR